MNAQVGTAFIKFHNYHVIIEELAQVKLFGSVFASSKVLRSAMLGIDFLFEYGRKEARLFFFFFFFRLVIMIFVPFLFRSRSLTLKRA